MEEGKTLRDGWRRGRLYEIEGGGEDFTGWMEEGNSTSAIWAASCVGLSEDVLGM